MVGSGGVMAKCGGGIRCHGGYHTPATLPANERMHDLLHGTRNSLVPRGTMGVLEMFGDGDPGRRDELCVVAAT